MAKKCTIKGYKGNTYKAYRICKLTSLQHWESVIGDPLPRSRRQSKNISKLGFVGFWCFDVIHVIFVLFICFSLLFYLVYAVPYFVHVFSTFSSPPMQFPWHCIDPMASQAHQFSRHMGLDAWPTQRFVGMWCPCFWPGKPRCQLLCGKIPSMILTIPVLGALKSFHPYWIYNMIIWILLGLEHPLSSLSFNPR